MPDPKKFKPISDFYKNKKQEKLPSREQHKLDLLIKETNLTNQDKKEFYTTGFIKKPRSITYKKQKEELDRKKTFISQDNRTKEIQEIDENKGKFEQSKKEALKRADVVTDVIQLGNFVPHPAFQTIGKAGNVLGSAIDGYQSYNDFSNGNYGSGSLNLASAMLPMFLGKSGYRRDMYNTNPSSLADNIASLGSRNGNYIPLTTLPHAITSSTIKGINYNKALLGTLGAETIYDTQYAMGGQLNNNNMQNNNSLTRFNEGGLHHQNPLGGVPVGGNNTVEQGETKMKNYVYSNRIAIDENMTKEMNLPNYIKGKTFADASKAIDNKFKDRNDKPSLETKKALLERLANAQEILKQQKEQEANKINEALKINSTQTPDMMSGQIPQGMKQFVQEQNQMFLGGKTEEPSTDLTSVINGGVQALNSLSTGNIDKTGTDVLKTASSVGLNALVPGLGMAASPITDTVSNLINNISGKKQMARQRRNDAFKISNQFTNDFASGGNLKPWELPVSTIEDDPNYNNPLFKPTNTIPQVGAGKPSDFLGYSIKPKNILSKPPTADMNTNIIQNIQSGLNVTADGIWGPKSNQAYFNDRIKRDPEYAKWAKDNNATTSSLTKEDMLESGYTEAAQKRFGITSQGYKYLDPETPDTSMLKSPEQTFVEPTGVRQGMEDYYQKNKTTDTSDTQDNQGNWLDRNGGKFLRYAPVAMSAYQLSQLKKPKYERLDRLNNVYKPTFVDEKNIQNIVSNENENTINALTNSSNGSIGTLRSNILGANLNAIKGMSDAYLKSSELNNSQKQYKQQFDLGVNQANIAQSNAELDINDRNKANYDTQKSKFLGQIGSDLGEIGKEQTFKKQAEKITGYSWMGDFLNKNPEYKAQFDAIMKDPSLDDNSKRAKAKALADSVYKGFNPEQINLANNSASLVGSYGLIDPNEKPSNILKKSKK